MRSSSRCCCRNSAVGRDPSRAGVPAAQPADTSRLPALSERSGEPSRTARVEAAPDAELPTAWLLAGILLGRAGAVSRLGERRRRTAHCQRRDCGDGPAYRQALTTGHVELPRRRIHAGLWFRLLRTLLDELNTPLSTCGTYAGYLRQIWECCGHPLRAGQSLWRPYETLNPAVRLQMLEAAATAISLIEVRDISPPGEHAKLFWSEPQTGFTSGLPAKAPKPEPVDHWQRAIRAIDEAIIEARHNPETARSLFALASYGRRDPASLEQLRATFAKEGIPGISVTL